MVQDHEVLFQERLTIFLQKFSPPYVSKNPEVVVRDVGEEDLYRESCTCMVSDSFWLNVGQKDRPGMNLPDS